MVRFGDAITRYSPATVQTQALRSRPKSAVRLAGRLAPPSEKSRVFDLSLPTSM